MEPPPLPPPPPPPQARGAAAIVDALWGAADSADSGCGCGAGGCACARGCGACIIGAGEELLPAALLRAVRARARAFAPLRVRARVASRLSFRR
jgi:hypothetical protein